MAHTLSEPTSAELAATAASLAGTGIDRLVPVLRGGNNRLFRVDAADGRTFALKCYLHQSADRRDRLGAEVEGLNFVWQRGIRSVPPVVAVDRDRAAALFGWIDGTPVSEAGAADIDAAIGFITDLKDLSTDPAARKLPLASEACLSAAELVAQIERRYDRLKREAAGRPELTRFLDYHFASAFARYTAVAFEGYRAAGIDIREPTPVRTLSPSDFGFHNALRRPDGAVAFLDFEYFGWDDPVKLVADFLLHPGMRLAPDLERRFLAGAGLAFQQDRNFGSRLRLLYPLFGMRWVMILLNEFLPERWQRRAFAGTADRELAEARQLAKAEDMLWQLATTQGGLPDVA